MPNTAIMELQSFGPVLTIVGRRTPQGRTVIAARAFDGKESLVCESGDHGIRRAFLAAQRDRELTAHVGSLVADAWQRYNGAQALAEDHAVIAEVV